MMKHIKIISNPHSGRNRKNPKHLKKLSQIAQGAVCLPELATMDQSIARLREEEVDILGISGGDGTIHQVLSSIFRVYRESPWPKIALLSSGTMNNISRNLGVRKSPAKFLSYIMEKLYRNQELSTIKRSPLIFDEHRAGFIFGQGGIARFLEVYDEGGNTSQWKAAYLLLRAIGSSFINGAFVQKVFAPVDMELEVDGRMAKHNRYTVAVLSSIADMGFGFRPCYHTLQDQSKAQFIGFTRHPIFTAFALPKMRLALPVKRADVEDQVGTQFILRPKEKMIYTIDGDLYHCEKMLSIRLGPKVEFII